MNDYKRLIKLIEDCGDKALSSHVPLTSEFIARYLIRHGVEINDSPKRILFVDMDGTLCRFHDEENFLERMFEENFFKNLKPFTCVKALDNINDDYAEVFILSSTISERCRKEKREWLRNYLPFINDSHIIFTDVNTSKSEVIKELFGVKTLNDNFILYDDYNVNLEDWKKAGGMAIKCINNINNNGTGAYGGDVGNKWKGYAISNEKFSIRELYGIIEDELENALRLEFFNFID